MTEYRVKRIYEPPAANDGLRVLVDRVWPRGVSRQDADLDLWLKDIAPSTDLRKWFAHQPERFPEFTNRYRRELANNPAVTELHEAAAGHELVTLLYSARDEQHNQAVVLAEWLNSAQRSLS